MTGTREDQTDPGSGGLRALMTITGLTYDALARAVTQIARESGNQVVRPNRSAVHRWLAGAIPEPGTRRYVVEAFSRRIGRTVTVAELGWPAEDGGVQLGLTLTKDPVTSLSELAHADLRRRTFLSSAAYSVLGLGAVVGGDPSRTVEHLARSSRAATGQRISMAEVAAVRAVTSALNALDEKMGGKHGRDTVVTWLANDVLAMCKSQFHDETTRKAMFSAAAEAAYLAGFKAQDAELESLAQRYYMLAYQLAGQNAGSGHDAYILRIMSHHALDLKRPEHSVDAAMAAWGRVQAAGPQQQSLYAFTVSRAHAGQGDARQAGIWLAKAERLSSRDDDSPVPSWVSLGGSPQRRMDSQAAKTWTELGRHAKAESLFARSAVGWDSGTHTRVKALAMNNWGVAQYEQGHVEQACQTWTEGVEALQTASSGSARARTALAGIRSRISTPRHRTTAAARQLAALLSQAPQIK